MKSMLLVGAILLTLVFPPQTWAEQEQAKAKIINNSIGMEFVFIPAGSFVMGNSEGKGDETGLPLHNVSITKPFYMQTKEVTQRQWAAIMNGNPSYFKGDWERPVETVSWDDVQNFIMRLSAKENTNNYRLPTEAEWEYACRAGLNGKKSFGEDPATLDQYAWYAENSRDNTHTVGKKLSNAWGLYDLRGNVWEWCADFYTWDNMSSASVQDPCVDEYPRNRFDDDKNKYRTMKGGGLYSNVLTPI